MNKNFYNNPLFFVWQGRKNLLPDYLIIVWFSMLLLSVSGVFYNWGFNISKLTLDSHFSITSTGLTMTLALFVAGKSAFSEEDLKILAKYKSEKIKEGQALIDFFAPYVFTAILFFLTGLVSLFGPYINFEIDEYYLLIAKLIYFNILSLGFFSLFNLVIVMLNDVYSKAYRKN